MFIPIAFVRDHLLPNPRERQRYWPHVERAIEQISYILRTERVNAAPAETSVWEWADAVPLPSESPAHFTHGIVGGYWSPSATGQHTPVDGEGARRKLF